jgi:uncharacterized RDD family membrane protein YckC
MPSLGNYFAEDNISNNIIDRVVTMLLYGIYMSLIEGIFKGKSLGKLITRTKAVNLDGSAISWNSAFLRGFSRIVPFEPFSALSGIPWHDKWSDTIVIDESKSFLKYQTNY